MTLQVFALQAVFTGVFATLILDIWQRLLFSVSGIPPADWGLIGRWFAYLPKGRLIHRPIGETPAVAGEAAIGWTMHYLVGIAYGFAYLGLMVFGLDRPPSLLNGFVFGAVSVVIPWFIMQPGLGAGIMARLAPNPWIPRLNALASHALYGIALYGGVQLAAQL
ncbi:DUF2938 domain-containing protein [Pelagibius litoralis]|uniref:DUF2938 domain-containing protein n=1 Tax=Pelagibius litoralis TaxID=374515 RepID=A0A967EV66_9PROT|nr:DUF2938 family protein [Pelagibius litoralis]NIA67384.1 DUF2938 domain-containing protein [Pelagibius litoralis]